MQGTGGRKTSPEYGCFQNGARQGRGTRCCGPENHIQTGPERESGVGSWELEGVLGAHPMSKRRSPETASRLFLCVPERRASFEGKGVRSSSVSSASPLKMDSFVKSCFWTELYYWIMHAFIEQNGWIMRLNLKHTYDF